MPGSVLLIDNYDSFTFNLAHLLAAAGAEPVVVRNDQITAGDAIAREDRAIVISPGPCTPDEAGESVPIAKAALEAGTPLFGVCLGLQSMVAAEGGAVIRAHRLMHGKLSVIDHDSSFIFNGLPIILEATRYHSLIADPATLPDAFSVTARSADDGEIMAVSHREKPAHAVQFHPESIASAYGVELLRAFLEIADGARRS
ncbi:MAG: aminodeoxychorismate/anthranilate synthase component II [Pseudomonadota bacterium]